MSLSFRSLRTVRGFSLLEMVAVIVVVSFLAGLSWVVYGAVVERSEDRAAELTLRSVGREAAPLALADGRSLFDMDDWEASIGDLPTGDGWVANTDPFGYSGSPREIHVALGGEPAGALTGLALLTPRGSCVFGLSTAVDQTMRTWVVREALGAACSGGTALEGPGAEPEPIDPIEMVTPHAPEGLAVVSGDTTLAVSWSAPSGGFPPSGYRVFVDGAPWGADLDPDVFSVVVSGLTNGRTYDVAVRALAPGAPDGGPPAAGAGMPLPPAPVLVEHPSVVDHEDGTATVSWALEAGSPPAELFYVFWGTSESYAANLPVVVGPSESSLLLEGLDFGVDYFVWVEAVNLEVTQGPLEAHPHPFRPMPPLPPQAAMELTSPSPTELAVNWTVSAGATSYHLYYNTTHDYGTSVPVVVPGGTTSHLLEGLAPGTRYWVWLEAWNLSGSADQSKDDAPTRPGNPGPAALSVVANSSSTLEVGVPSGNLDGQVVDELRVYRDGVATPIWTGANPDEFVDSGLVGGTGYTYRVAAANSSGEGPRSAASVTTPPAAPSVTVSTSGVDFSGEASAVPTGAVYRIQVRDNSSSVVFDNVAASRSFAATGVTSQRYQVRAQARNAAGHFGSWSGWSPWSAWTRPAAVSSLSAGSGGVFMVQGALSMTNPAGTSYNELHRRIADLNENWAGAFATPTAGAGATTHIDATGANTKVSGGNSVGLRGFNVRYIVRACNSNGCSGNSPEVTWADPWPAFGSDVRGVNVARTPHDPLPGYPGHALQPITLDDWNGAGKVGTGVGFAHNWGGGAVLAGYPDGVDQLFRFKTLHPWYGCYLYRTDSDDGTRVIADDNRWGGTSIVEPENGINGWTLWNNMGSQSGRATAGTPQCSNVAPGTEVAWAVNHREIDGAALFSFEWAISGKVPFAPVPREYVRFGAA